MSKRLSKIAALDFDKQVLQVLESWKVKLKTNQGDGHYKVK